MGRFNFSFHNWVLLNFKINLVLVSCFSFFVIIITGNPPRSFMDRRWKPTVELAPNCPRCNSSNTKFCYYNNYSLTQPRYFCKSCRRYWTKGGSLRNVPVGGGCRKNRRAKLGSVTGSLISRCSLPDSDRSRTSDPLVNWEASESETLANDDKSSTINLALVYSKLLNQENLLHIDQDSSFVVPEIQNQFEPPVNLTTTQSQFVHQNNMVQCGDYSGLAADDISNHVLLGEFEPNQYYDQQKRIEQPMNSDFINLGFQPMPNSGVLQDIFMSSLQLPQPPLIEPADNSSLNPKFSDLFSSL